MQGTIHNKTTPPHNIEAEQALLGAILVNNDALDRVADFLTPDHFYEPLHARIYAAYLNYSQRNRLISPITLKHVFEREKAPDLKDINVPQYLGRLAANAATVISARDYGLTILELYRKRQLLGLFEDIVYGAFHEISPEQMIEQIEDAVQSVSLTSPSLIGPGKFEDALADMLEDASAAFQRATEMAGLPTGITDLDQRTGGLAETDLIIIAGRPSMGKTALATNIAFHNARNGVAVGFPSMEMSAKQLAARIVGAQSNISSDRIRRGDFTEEEFSRIAAISLELKNLPIYIDPRGGLNIAQLCSQARRWKKNDNIGLLVIDYIQLMRGTGQRRGDNRTQEISEITSGLKALAKELQIPIIALSQLSRNLEMRANKRPLLSDLRESGSIEQDADVVMFVYRDEYYLGREEPDSDDAEGWLKWDTKIRRVRGKAEIICSKLRHGRIGTVHCAFRDHITTFADLPQAELEV